MGWGEVAPRGALRLAPSPGADLELLNSSIETLEDVPALLALGRAVPALHPSPGVGSWAVRLAPRFGLEEVGVQNLASVAMATPRKRPGRGNPRAEDSLGREGRLGGR